jgi:tRNA-dihydrouridine synthase B
LEQKPSGLIPIIGNGDIQTHEDLLKIVSLGYDGVMVGRGLFGKPWILGQLTDNIQTPNDIKSVVLEHLGLVLEYYGPKSGIPLFRKHAAWYSAGIKNSAEFRIKVNQITDQNELKSVICEFFNCFGNS